MLFLVEHRDTIAHVLEGDAQLVLPARQLFGTSAQFVEQPSILNRYYGLVGKRRDQPNLLFGKRLDVRAREGDDADQRLLANQWHPEHRPLMPELHRFGPSVFPVNRRIFDMYRTSLEHRAAGQCAAAWRDRILRLEIAVFWGNPERGDHPAETVLQSEDKPRISPANARCSLDQRVEHRLQIKCRAA